jgi:hypothetical protein
MNLVTLTDTRLGLYRVPVRLTSVKENPDRTLSCEAEQYIYGMHHPTVKETTTPSGTLVISNPSPGLVNDPIIFEYTAAMLGGPSNPQIGFIVSGADENYGGCIVHVSVDGGESYTPLNPCAKCTQGVLSAGLAIGSDPDTTHTLAVDLTESRGSMSSQIQVIADTFSDPCYVESATGYEIVCPTTAILTAPHKYNLTSYLRRGCLGTTIATHTTGQKFGVINSSVLKVDLPTEWLGKTLYFKFVAVNQAGGQQNQLSECTAYPFTPTSSGYPAILFQVNGE